MSGGFDDPVARAGEYVLGLLDAEAARAVEAAAARDPMLAAAIAAWARDLEPLTGPARASPADPALWRRIETTLDGRADAPHLGRARGRPSEIWRRRGRLMVGLGVAALAACLAVLLWRAPWTRVAEVAPPPIQPAPVPVAPEPEPRANPAASVAPAPLPPVQSTVPAPSSVAPPVSVATNEPAVAAGLLMPKFGGDPLHASVTSAGTIQIRVPRPIAVGGERRLDVWAKPRDAVGPRLLGELPGAGGTLSFGGLAANGAVVMVTDDRRGPAGARAPGTTLYQGILASAKP